MTLKNLIGFLIVIALLNVGSYSKCYAQKLRTDVKLQRALEDAAKNFRGDVGIFVRHLKTGKEAAIHADTVFPTASIIKVPILVGLFDKIWKKELDYRQELLYSDTLYYGGSGLMQFYKDSAKTDVSVLASLMITYSDNVTALWCQHLAGGGQTINALMDRYGFVHTRVNSRTPGREDARRAYGWGQTTPREIAMLLTKIRLGEIVSQTASDRMYRLMTNIYYDEGALSQIPGTVASASKQGMVNASRSEVVLVNAPSGDYVFSIMTKNNTDQRWTHDNEASELIRTISSLLWNHFEPKHSWKPVKERF